MNCLACKTTTMVEKELETDLLALECPTCEGRWIQASRYWQWLRQHGSNLPEKPSSNTILPPVAESRGAKICPECGHILTRCRVGHDLSFHLDRCTACGGIWFDKNEWEILKSRNLHDDIHFIFSSAWQSQALREEIERHLQQMLERKLSEQDFAEAQRIRQWLSTHPYHEELYAFLKPDSDDKGESSRRGS